MAARPRKFDANWRFLGGAALVALCFLLLVHPGRAQSPPHFSESFWLKPVIVHNWHRADERTDSVAPATARFPLFGMPAGFLTRPLGLEDDDDVAGENTASGRDDLAGVQLVLGSDNPFFDPLRPGNLGGVGYYQVHSQLQMLDTGGFSVCLNLNAYTPAGLQSGGIENGTTFVRPSLAWFQDLGMGTALHGFVGQNMRPRLRSNDHFRPGAHFGLAWQCPIPTLDDEEQNNLFFFIQALGGFRYEQDRYSSRPGWDIFPGIHWRMNNNCWMSLGGYRHGLITCSWQY